MNQRGEVTLLSILSMILIFSVLTLSALKLRHSYELLQRRSKLFLCAKETKEEMNRYLIFMGRTNWGIENILKLSLIMLFIPGLQPVAANAPKARKLLQQLQNVSLVAYVQKLHQLKGKGCPIDPRMLITPFELGAVGYIRNTSGSAKLRNKKWEYFLVKKPYLIVLSSDARTLNAVWPKLTYSATEKGEKLSFLSSSPY